MKLRAQLRIAPRLGLAVGVLRNPRICDDRAEAEASILIATLVEERAASPACTGTGGWASH